MALMRLAALGIGAVMAEHSIPIRGLRPKHYDVVAKLDAADGALQLLANGNQRNRRWQQR
jgi:hypothetical protein